MMNYKQNERFYNVRSHDKHVVLYYIYTYTSIH